MPAEGATVVLTVTESTAFLVVGEPVYVQNWGTMLVTAIPSDLSVTVENLEDTAANEYLGNAAPGTSLAAGSKIVPSGFQGTQGETPAGALLSANDLNDVADATTARTNLGLGTAAVLDSGVGNADLAQNDGALVDGDAVFATAAGIETKTAADARTALGLDTMSEQAADSVAITGGTIAGTTELQVPLVETVSLIVIGTIIIPASSTQILTAATQIDANAGKLRVEGDGGPVTITAIPTISPPSQDGQQIVIVGTDDTNTVTLQNESALAGTKLKLGAASRALGAGDVLSLVWDEGLDRWLEMGFVNNS
jgi:hypothetical protein